MIVTAVRVAWWLYALFNPDDVLNKSIIITGASSGIGEHLAYEYAKGGAKLMLTGRREEALKDVATKCRKKGASDVATLIVDVTKEEDCKRMIEETVSQYGRLDHLVTNAGIAHSFLMEEARNTEVANIMEVDFWGNVYPTFYALPYLRRSRGTIVVISSIAAYIPFPRMALYNAAKAALYNFYDTLRVETAPDVSITIAFPGCIESEMTAGKFMTAKGEMDVSKEQRNVHVGPAPVEPAETCAKAILGGTLRRQRYVRVPWWYTTFLYYRVFAPDVLDALIRIIYTAPRGKAPLSKIIADSVAQPLLYPESIQTTGVKAE